MARQVIDPLLGRSGKRAAERAPVASRAAEQSSLPVVVPDSLIAVQAYVMWEEAGKPQVGCGGLPVSARGPRWRTLGCGGAAGKADAVPARNQVPDLAQQRQLTPSWHKRGTSLPCLRRRALTLVPLRATALRTSCAAA